MITIRFEAHATTFDNEQRLASGHYDVGLSRLGESQALNLGTRYSDASFGAIFCSDLQRSYRTAEIAFPLRHYLILRDSRLRECDYGDWTGRPTAEIEAERLNRIQTPFPNGESYVDCVQRVEPFLGDLKRHFSGKHVLVIGHRATQYALEHLICGVALATVVLAKWKWQPGWTYHLSEVNRVCYGSTTR